MDPSDLEEFEGLDYESPFPECRVLTGWDVAGMIRFDMSKDRAALLAKSIDDGVDGHPPDEHVRFRIGLGRRAYEEFSRGLGEVRRMGGPEQVAAKQVVVDPDPAISVSVLYNASQIEDLDATTNDVLSRSEPVLRLAKFAVEISCSKNGAQLLVQQLAAAVKGAENPLDHVDPEGVDA